MSEEAQALAPETVASDESQVQVRAGAAGMNFLDPGSAIRVPAAMRRTDSAASGSSFDVRQPEALEELLKLSGGSLGLDFISARWSEVRTWL